MTSANVTQTSGFLPFVASVTNVNNVPTGDNFSQVMNLTKNAGKTQDAIVDSTKPKDASMNLMQNKASTRTSAGKADDANGNAGLNTADKKAIKDALDAAGEEIKKAICEELDVSEEDLENAMEILGLTVMDLLDPQNMQNLVMELTGQTDALQFLTNEDLFTSLQELNAFASEAVNQVAEEMGIPQDEFATVMEEVFTPITEETNPTDEAPAFETQTDKFAAQSEKTDVQTVETDAESKVAAAVEKTDDVTDKQIKEEVPTEEVTEVSHTEDTHVTEKSSEKQSRHDSNEQNHSFMQEFNGKTTFSPEALEKADAVPTNMPSPSEIMDQIAEYVKINAKPELTEMEMQLHPESLGTLNIKVAAKEGVVTAQFATHSEDVKAALEVQIIQLKESLNEQGIKVDAVEVTVESHAFHQNMQQGAQSGGNEYSEPKKKNLHQIILDDDIAIDEMDLDDETRIAAEMMKQNGNTVDMTA